MTVPTQLAGGAVTWLKRQGYQRSPFLSPKGACRHLMTPREAEIQTVKKDAVTEGSADRDGQGTVQREASGWL